MRIGFRSRYNPPTARSFQLINIPARQSERSKMRSPSSPTEGGESATETRRTGATARGGRRRVLRGRRVSGYLPLRATARSKIVRWPVWNSSPGGGARPGCRNGTATPVGAGGQTGAEDEGVAWCVRIVQALTRGQRVGRNVNSRVRRGHASRLQAQHACSRTRHDTVSHSARNVVL